MTRLLLRLYPRVWRERYGEELLDLVSDSGLTPRAAADIARAGLAERVRTARSTLIGGTSMIFTPAWRHPTAWALVGLIALLPLAFAIVGLSGATNSLQTWLNTNRLADLVLVTLPAIAAFFAGVPLVRLGVSRVEGSSELSLSVRLRAVNVVVVVVALAIGSFLVLHIVFESVMQVGS